MFDVTIFSGDYSEYYVCPLERFECSVDYNNSWFYIVSLTTTNKKIVPLIIHKLENIHKRRVHKEPAFQIWKKTDLYVDCYPSTLSESDNTITVKFQAVSIKKLNPVDIAKLKVRVA
jgi:penicillin-binding protein-related factor A (putative recombinase)